MESHKVQMTGTCCMYSPTRVQISISKLGYNIELNSLLGKMAMQVVIIMDFTILVRKVIHEQWIFFSRTM